MDNLRILHISDLHYRNSSQKEIELIKKAFIDDVDCFIKKNNLIPDFIIFSGDLVFKPDADLSSIEVFNEAYSFFIEPLLEKLELERDNIFITPGNHDINRERLNRGYREGLKSYREDKHTVNELIEEILNGTYNELKHLKQFNNFLNGLSNNNEIYSNELYRVYKFNKDKITIGIVNLNSNIFSFEKNTYGELVIGEKQLIDSYEYIKDCDIKIANIHHSTNWLIHFEQRNTKKFFYEFFNIVFIGHEHDEQPELIN